MVVGTGDSNEMGEGYYGDGCLFDIKLDGWV